MSGLPVICAFATPVKDRGRQQFLPLPVATLLYRYCPFLLLRNRIVLPFLLPFPAFTITGPGSADMCIL